MSLKALLRDGKCPIEGRGAREGSVKADVKH